MNMYEQGFIDGMHKAEEVADQHNFPKCGDEILKALVKWRCNRPQVEQTQEPECLCFNGVIDIMCPIHNKKPSKKECNHGYESCPVCHEKGRKDGYRKAQENIKHPSIVALAKKELTKIKLEGWNEAISAARKVAKDEAKRIGPGDVEDDSYGTSLRIAESINKLKRG